jgi:hypothetical protein
MCSGASRPSLDDLCWLSPFSVYNGIARAVYKINSWEQSRGDMRGAGASMASEIPRWKSDTSGRT